MMVDYSAWLESVEFPVDAIFLWLLLGVSACLIGGALVVHAVSTLKATMINRDAPVWLGVAGALLTLVGVLLMLFGAIPATQAMRDGSSITFVEQTEKAFDVRSLSCDGECPS
ncbi:hypothetical protein [Bifidobacterium sp. SO1]|uniref:hypothetical protein n=1 Tax=Bifidobacterium sp. SO1 TaxID=2809029 RepID=UPI001C303BC8|nr:hypothetical protein [Bifidobacterium sp. SO1]